MASAPGTMSRATSPASRATKVSRAGQLAPALGQVRCHTGTLENAHREIRRSIAQLDGQCAAAEDPRQRRTRMRIEFRSAVIQFSPSASVARVTASTEAGGNHLSLANASQ
jgi:hypothetical protein